MRISPFWGACIRFEQSRHGPARLAGRLLVRDPSRLLDWGGFILAGRKKSDRFTDNCNGAGTLLPQPPIARWMPSHKAALAAAIIEGRITPERIMSVYGVSHEESARWVSLYARHAQQGLKTTYCQLFRDTGGRSLGVGPRNILSASR